MVPFREGIFSSLVTRLTLAVLAVLVLSLGVTTAVFVTQLQFSDRNAARHVLAQQTLAIQIRANVLKSLENNPSLATNPANHPLARMGGLPAGVDRVLLTTWPDNVVAGDTQNDHTVVGKPLAPVQSDAYTIGGVDYVYRVLPGLDPQVLAEFNLPPYRTIVILAKVTPLPARAWSVVRSLALAGAIALLISLLAALVVLRAITRPLRSMTLASERMAAGDYDQHVAVSQATDEVGQLAHAFNHMASEVKRVREMQRQFVANVSHDLRSPLTSIIGFSQALTDDTTITPQQRRAAEIINNEAERLYRLTRDLLDLSRLEAGRLALSKRPLDLNDVLRDVAVRYQAPQGGRAVRFVEDLSDAPLPILGDPDRLAQVAGNLLDNAVKFCAPGGEVRLRSVRQGGTAVVEVYNSGPGIAPKDVPRVFDRFYRGDHSRAQQTGGSGIGLAIVRELVHVHGGEVTPSSELGVGTTMTVRLPLALQEPFTKDLQPANTGVTSLPL